LSRPSGFAILIALVVVGCAAWVGKASASSSTAVGQSLQVAAGSLGAGHEGGGEHDQAEHVGTANAGDHIADPVEFKADIAIATLVTFFLLLVILTKFAWGPISEGLEKREAAIAAQISGAEDANRAAKVLLKEHEKKLAEAASQVREMLEEARRDAEQAKAAILAEAKAAADLERARGLREIEDATGQALKTLAEKSANLAVELAGKIVQTKLSPDEHAKLIEDAVGRFPAIEASRN
jgi:F-type H+-transporting ATPase subunit b